MPTKLPRITVTIAPEDREALDQVAASLGIPAAAYMRKALRERLKRDGVKVMRAERGPGAKRGPKSRAEMPEPPQGQKVLRGGF